MANNNEAGLAPGQNDAGLAPGEDLNDAGLAPADKIDFQERIMFDGKDIIQPDEDGYAAILATTDSEDTTRSLAGKLHTTPLFTVFGYNLKWTNPSAKDVAKILSMWVNKKQVKVHYYDILTASWKDDYFYARNFNAPSKTVKHGHESWSELSFDIRIIDGIKA